MKGKSLIAVKAWPHSQVIVLLISACGKKIRRRDFGLLAGTIR
jgi:hypothetical protein